MVGMLHPPPHRTLSSPDEGVGYIYSLFMWSLHISHHGALFMTTSLTFMVE